MKQQGHVILTCIDGSLITDAVCDYASWLATTLDAPVRLLHTIDERLEPAVTDFSGTIGLGSQEDLLNELTEIEQNYSSQLIEQGQHILNSAQQRVSQQGVNLLEMAHRHGNVVESLVEMETDTQMVVMGIRGAAHEQTQTGVGTQVEEIIRAIHRPIFVVSSDYSTPKTMMLAYDGSENARKALALVVSNPLFHDMVCHLVYVGDNEQLLVEAESVLKKTSISVITARLTGSIEQMLLAYQAKHSIELLLMGAFSHHRVRDFFLGSLTAKVLAAANIPLLLIR